MNNFFCKCAIFALLKEMYIAMMAEPFKFCKYCQFWKSPDADRRGESMGLCDNVMVASQVHMEKRESYTIVEKVIFTEGNFGCIYWRDGNLRRTPISRVL